MHNRRKLRDGEEDKDKDWRKDALSRVGLQHNERSTLPCRLPCVAASACRWGREAHRISASIKKLIIVSRFFLNDA